MKVFLNSKAERIHRQPAGIPHGTVRMQVLKPESDSAPDSACRGSDEPRGRQKHCSSFRVLSRVVI